MDHVVLVGELVGDVEAARPGDPAEIAVEDEEPDQPEPEDRHGIADQAQEADELVGPAAPMRRGRDAGRDADEDSDQRGDGGELQRRRERRGRCPPKRAAPSGSTCRNRRSARRRYRWRTASGAAGRGRAPGAAASYCAWLARSPTMASTGSIGMMRPIRKVTRSRPKKVMSEAQRRLRGAPGDPGKSHAAEPGTPQRGARRKLFLHVRRRRAWLDHLPVTVAPASLQAPGATACGVYFVTVQ